MAATFAENAPHAVRTIVMVPAWYLLAGAGFRPLWGWLRRRSYQWDWLLLLGLSAGFYLFMLFRYYPAEQGRSWQSGNLEGYRAAMAEVEAGRYKQIVDPPGVLPELRLRPLRHGLRSGALSGPGGQRGRRDDLVLSRAGPPCASTPSRCGW